MEAVRGALRDNGLSIVHGQRESSSLDCITVVTRLLHESGEWLETEITMPLPRTGAGGSLALNPQTALSALTSARKAAVESLLGVVHESPDETPKARSASARVAAASAPPPQERSEPAPRVAADAAITPGIITPAQVSAITSMCRRQRRDLVAFAMDRAGCALEAMTDAQAAEAIRWLNDNKETQAA
jgi:hypothetical protein